MSDTDLTLGRPAGGGAIGIGQDSRARRETRVIYAGLAVAGLFAILVVMLLTGTAARHTAGVASDTKYDFAYRDPHTIISHTDRIIVDADVFVTVTPHKDAPDTVTVQTTRDGGPSNASFTWTIAPQMGPDGPVQLAGEFFFEGSLFRACEAIIGSPSNFPPRLNRLYAEQYSVINNTGLRYRAPRTVDPAPFVNFMRTTIDLTKAYMGDGSLPDRRIRVLAGDLIPACMAP